MKRIDAPDIPEDVAAADLDPDARGRLRTLSKDNAEDVARHLVMAGRLLEDDPELAYRHAQVALARGGRVDVVREAAALTAYATGRFAEALREFRTVARLNGSYEHLALMADCERGLGRPERVLELAASAEVKTLSDEARCELQVVVAGARADMGQLDVALHTLDRIQAGTSAVRDRVSQARAEIERGAGLVQAGAVPEGSPAHGQAGAQASPTDSRSDDMLEEEVIVYDLEDETDG